MRTSLLALFLLTATACAVDDTGGNPGTWDPPAQSDVDATMTDCTGDLTCVVVELGCCDHCNGGAAIAVVSGSEADAMSQYGQTCNEPVACTEMGCAPLTAECQADACVLVEGTL